MPLTRYERPQIEIEYNREAMVKKGCCRFIPVVLRLCGVPHSQHVMLTVMFERARKRDREGTLLDDYEVHPSSNFLRQKGIPGYYEYAVELLARPHDEETGTVRIKMESQAYNVLSEAVYVLDCRQDAPVQRSCLKGSFRAIRMVPFIRSVEERDALHGQFPASVGIREVPLPSQVSVAKQEVGMVSLFPQFEEEERGT
jgi:hypothetical protein